MAADGIELANGMVLDKDTISKHFGSSKTRSAKLYEDWIPEDGSITAPYGSLVYFYYSGTIESLILMRTMYIPGTGLAAKAGTKVTFFENGPISEFTLYSDYDITPGLTAKAGTFISFYESGEINSFVPKYDVALTADLSMKAGEYVLLFENKSMMAFHQAKRFVGEDGYTYEQNMYLIFNDKGLLTKIYYKPEKNYQDPIHGFYMESGMEMKFDYTTGIMLVVLAYDWIDSRDGKLYKVGVQHSIKY